MNAATITLTDIVTAAHTVTDNETIQHAVWDVMILDKSPERTAADRSLSLLTVRNYVQKTKATIFQATCR